MRQLAVLAYNNTPGISLSEHAMKTLRAEGSVQQMTIALMLYLPKIGGNVFSTLI